MRRHLRTETVSYPVRLVNRIEQGPDKAEKEKTGHS